MLVWKDLPATAGVTLLHRDLRQDIFEFRDELRRAQTEVPQQDEIAPDAASKPALTVIEAMRRIQMYSRAVQVFAHLAVEALLNEYGFLRFGEEVFERNLRSKGPVAKLEAMLKVVSGASAEESATILEVLRRLSHRRNDIIHPRPEVFAPDSSGVFTRITSRRVPSSDATAAEAAIQDMEEFFRLFQRVDPEAAFFLDVG